MRTLMLAAMLAACQPDPTADAAACPADEGGCMLPSHEGPCTYEPAPDGAVCPDPSPDYEGDHWHCFEGVCQDPTDPTYPRGAA